VSRLFYIQVISSDRLQAAAAGQYKEVSSILARRGEILASDGFPLAASLPSYLLYADPQLIDKPKEIAAVGIVVYKYDVIGLNLEKFCNRRGGSAGFIHECIGERCNYLALTNFAFREFGVPFFFKAKVRKFMLFPEQLNYFAAEIMPRVFVFVPGVAKTDDEECFHGFRTPTISSLTGNGLRPNPERRSETVGVLIYLLIS
jgi:cell division protein FtsI/penicillin-binding protein 2